MQKAKQIVHSSQSYPLPDGLAMLRYVGLKYPESQWTSLFETTPHNTTNMAEIGHITLEAEGAGVMHEVERKLLSMARRHGAHIVLIDFIKTFQLKNKAGKPVNKGVHIYGRCQRFEL